jgi:hypothetical protein
MAFLPTILVQFNGENAHTDFFELLAAGLNSRIRVQSVVRAEDPWPFTLPSEVVLNQFRVSTQA